MARTLRVILRETHRALTSALLVGAMVAPVAASMAGWPIHTPFHIPIGVHVALLAAVALIAFGSAQRGVTPSRWAVVGWLLAGPLGVAFALLVELRANVFYTGRALVEGMAVLFVLHLGVALLRRRAVARLDLRFLDPVLSPRWHRTAAWRQRVRARCLPATPGIRLAEGATRSTGWLVLLAWVLIALEHRHPAGPVLMLAGALEALALIALLPDALVPVRKPPAGATSAHDGRWMPGPLLDDVRRAPASTPLARRQP